MPDRRASLTAISNELHLQFVQLVALNAFGDPGLAHVCRLVSDAIDAVDVAALACTEAVPA